VSQKYPGGLITKSPPATVGPVDGEGGSAPGVWTLDQATALIKQGLWPKPLIPRQLWGWGFNSSGQLGLGDTTIRSSPNQAGALVDWLKISAGRYYTLAIKQTGTLWAWGSNGDAQLGLGDTTDRSSPAQVGALTTWSSVSAGRNFSFAVRTNGTLWSWGFNTDGQLGQNNTTSPINSPVQVGALTDWVSAAAGYKNTLAVKSNGTLWSWGGNYSGQLGLNNTTNYSSPKQVGALTNWAQVFCSTQEGCAFAIKTNNTIWSWGSGNNGALGHGNEYNYSSPKQIGALTNWAQANAGYLFVVAAKTDGTLWAWGRNNSYQLGLGNLTFYSSPKQVGSNTTWSSVAAGYNSGYAIRTDGTMWVWGANTQGQLGLGDVSGRILPVQMGALATWRRVAGGNFFTVALKTP
jgi:alpha-tubulin suppressor-like RCC1 family protein